MVPEEGQGDKLGVHVTAGEFGLSVMQYKTVGTEGAEDIWTSGDYFSGPGNKGK